MKQIKDSNNYCDELGNFYNKSFKKLNPKCLNAHGYLRIGIIINNKQYSKLTHRLIAETFIPNPLNLATVDHINGIKTDNRVENLQWMSNADNIRKSVFIQNPTEQQLITRRYNQNKKSKR